MIRRIMGLMFVVFLHIGIVPDAQAQPVARYSYLGKAANQLMDVRLKGRTASVGEFAQAMSSACEALKLLIDDPEFRSVLAAYKHSGGAAREVLANIDQLGRFLEFEQRVLREMGISEHAANDMVAGMTSYVRAAHSLDWSPKQVIDGLDKLRDAACTIADEAGERIKEHERWVLIIRVARGVTGAAFIVSNLMALPPTGGAAGASIAIGTSVLTDAF